MNKTTRNKPSEKQERWWQLEEKLDSLVETIMDEFGFDNDFCDLEWDGGNEVTETLYAGTDAHKLKRYHTVSTIHDSSDGYLARHEEDCYSEGFGTLREAHEYLDGRDEKHGVYSARVYIPFADQVYWTTKEEDANE